MTALVINAYRDFGFVSDEANFSVILTSNGIITLSEGHSGAVGIYNVNATISVEGSLTAMRIGAEIIGDNGKVIILDGGVITNVDPGYGAVSVKGNNSSIINEGTASGKTYALSVGTSIASEGASHIVNSGNLYAGDYGIYAVGLEDLVIRNTGLVTGGKASFYEAADGGIQKITNTGEMFGDVLMGGGNDVFNSRFGFVDGDIHGGEGNDRIKGSFADDRIYGDTGRDRIWGGAGEDTFVFNVRSPELGQYDDIKDFSRADDVFELQFPSVFRRSGALLAKEFTEIAAFDSNKGVEADDRVLYVKSDGAIYFDADGSGKKSERVLLAAVEPGLKLDHTDFQVEFAI